MYLRVYHIIDFCAQFGSGRFFYCDKPRRKAALRKAASRGPEPQGLKRVIVLKPFARGFYNSKAWQDCRNAYFVSQHGLCEKCQCAGKIVHHKVGLTPENINDPTITLNWENLELLCQECHNQVHFACEAVVGDLAFDADGNLVQR